MATPSFCKYRWPLICEKGHLVVHASRSWLRWVRAMLGGGGGQKRVGLVIDVVTYDIYGFDDWDVDVGKE